MLRLVAILRTDNSEERSSSETSVLISATRRNIPEEGIVHSHRHDNLKCHKWNLSLCLTNLSTKPWKRTGEWKYRSHFLHIGTSWRWLVKLTPRPLYLQGEPSVPIA
jgi:hypothetical protein